MRTERGFTLIELLVALTVSGVVVLLIHAVFTAVTGAGCEVRAARTALDHDANVRRWLAAAFLSLDVGTDSAAGPFEGRPDRMAVASWLEGPGGWFERERVTLGLDGESFVADLHAGPSGVGPDGSRIDLADSVTSVAFDYLLEPGVNTRWMQEWLSPVSAPLAVRIRIAMREHTDTLLLLIKGRG